MQYIVHPGKSFPLGATVTSEGTNFCVFSKNCAAVELLFFDEADAFKPTHTFRLDPAVNKTFYYWHAFIPGVKEGQLYGYRVYGQMAPGDGHRFDGSKLLLDPYTKSVGVGENYNRDAAKMPGDNAGQAMKSVVVDSDNYDWEGDKPLAKPFSKTIIYELHVGGFTKHPNSGVSDNLKGTYLGLIEKIPYLKDLGITAVELLPVQQFDFQDAPNRLNYWGYSPIAFFAPYHAYGTTSDPIQTVNEFRDMVKALHKAGIEVILDVVYNHTAEAGADGPIQSLKGFGNKAYYAFQPGSYQYADFTGCGNSLNANHSIVRRMIMDSIIYWVRDMHVDGFRFDLASVLARDERGVPMANPPILWEIESEPVLAGTKMIAEAWDAAGLYQVGNFIGDKWAEWNGLYRDDVRRFVKGDDNTAGGMVQRLIGSPDIFPVDNRDPNRSINFITCHDGFTLNDLVSYNQKHNLANGEDNRDGENDNNSWNCGVEGSTKDPDIEALRLKQIKNFFSVLFFSQGTPMILMGDEVRRTQKGNNNAYCQDNELSWFDWDNVATHKELHRFVKKLIHFILDKDIFQEERFWVDQTGKKVPHLTWHGTKLGEPDWGGSSHALAMTLGKRRSGSLFHVMFNAYWGELDFQLPVFMGNATWRRIVDTSMPAPYDFIDSGKSEDIRNAVYRVAPRSVVMLQVHNREASTVEAKR